VECGNSRGVNSYLAIKGGEGGIRTVVRMLLVIDKLLNEIGEVWLFNFSGDIFGVNFAYCTVG